MNVLKGEGDELTEAAAAVFSDVNMKFMIWVESIHCMSIVIYYYNYNNYTFSAQLPILYTVSGLMALYLKLTADFQKIFDISLHKRIQIQR